MKNTKIVISLSSEKLNAVANDLVLIFAKHNLSATERVAFVQELYDEMNLEVERITGHKITSLDAEMAD